MPGRPLAEWFTRAPPIRAVLLGKGPSLDDYGDADADGAFVMAINETAEVKRCDAAIYLDNFKLDIPRSVVVFQPPTALGSAVDETYLFKRRKQPKPGEEPLHIPQHGYGTATAAVTILGMWGVCEMLMVGFDSKDGGGQTGKYAICLEDVSRPNSAQAYVGINQGTQAAIDFYGIEARWFHRGERWPDG